MSTCLIITTGQTDVQLVIEGERFELEKNVCACLHHEIENRQDWTLINAQNITKAKSRKKNLPEGPFELCTPKLDAVTCYLDERDLMPTSVLILETRRDATKAKGDPRYAGAILEKRLEQFGVQDIRREAYLTGDKRLEGSDTSYDSIVRQDVVECLDKAIKNLLQSSDVDNVVVAARSGMPVVANLIEEIVRLHTPQGKTPTFLEIPDATKTGTSTHDQAIEREPGYDPIESYQARHRALELIENGNLLGAWGAVQHLHNHTASEWTNVVEWLACFASSRPMPSHWKQDILVLEHDKMAVRAALRVELALRAGDIPRAVHGTIAFFEAAFWDWLLQYDFSQETGCSKLGGSISDGFTFQQDHPTKEQEKRFREKNENSGKWYINDFARGIKPWLHKLNKPALGKLWKAQKWQVRNLRNDVAHNEPTQALMDQAAAKMSAAKLWSSSASPQSFLSQTLVKGVLSELGVDKPEDLLSGLLKEIRCRLLEPDVK
ncbi:MAG TPA: hypothetical protein DCE42_11875 [Myxococcales bacterium]|nr:hypothetical protein [Deltaproteobacteria bacterium]MBU48925.1 hypothetical protein [Deltaproteobacteria bacterium]HAA55449.1 hypothetical protein [Myxococcales bacterium]|tara:strand:- start:22367 stop:23842 length:1476 start_codon:yes stop_codon:yes gene_type:complete